LTQHKTGEADVKELGKYRYMSSVGSELAANANGRGMHVRQTRMRCTADNSQTEKLKKMT